VARHYYLGRIYRDRGEARWAADELDTALQSAPQEPWPWIALCELYRQWDYTDQVIEVAQQGTAVVPGGTEVSDVWYELGMAYDDKQRMRRPSTRSRRRSRVELIITRRSFSAVRCTSGRETSGRPNKVSRTS
jgi:predicted Zn-dependent protease